MQFRLLSRRYFTRTILQFQFAEALCGIAGHRGPLHRCDFSQSEEAGAALARLLAMGSSRPWPDVLETLTGTRYDLFSARDRLNGGYEVARDRLGFTQL